VSNEPPFKFLGKRGLQRRNKKWARRARASRRTHEKTGVFVLVTIVCLAGLTGLTGLTGLAVGLYFLLRPKSEPSPMSTPKPEAATIKPLTRASAGDTHAPDIDHTSSKGAAKRGIEYRCAACPLGGGDRMCCIECKKKIRRWRAAPFDSYEGPLT
jgi:hypothetical protein